MKTRVTVYAAFALIAGVAIGYAQSQIQAGYTLITPEAGSTVPAAAALFTYFNSEGVLVSQAGVEATEPIASGRIFVDEQGTRTGLAMVNPSPASASLTFILRDASGAEAARSSTTLGAGRHMARFVSELFPELPTGFNGSLTFSSDAPIAAITLRETLNDRSEPLYSTLPVVNLAAASADDRVVFPHIAAGSGYTTQLILINRSEQETRGRIRLVGSDGRALSLRSAGSDGSEVVYRIPGNGTFRAELDSPAGLSVGYAVIAPDAGAAAPAGTAIFLYKDGARLLTEAGVGATSPTTAARIFVDHIGSRTGVALANPLNQATPLELILLNRQGAVEETATRTLPPGGHLAIFADEVFPTFGEGNTGLMEIRSASPFVPITLKLTANSRGEPIVTTLPVADLNRPIRAPFLVVPQIAIGGGFSTRLICLNTERTNTASGTLSFFQSDGSAMSIPLGGQSGGSFGYRLAGGRQFYPGNAAAPSLMTLVDPLSNQPASEIAIIEGQSAQPRVRVFDSTGTIRDDFDVDMTSLSTDVATVDNVAGLVYGLKPGFSTLVLRAGGAIAASTATVTGIASAPSGFGVAVAQDQARRLYVASSGDHTIRLTPRISQAADVYAGVANTAGLRNDERLLSLFRSPEAIAIDPNSRSIFVADSANHTIRRIPQGASGRVETLAGTGSRGSADGPAAQASFDNPQGIALDGRGNLWVADTGNHTIRKINLIDRTVSTVAGAAGAAGFVDGEGGASRFFAPVGIALEPETVAEELERERRREPPPPVRMLVADTGNGAIRRIAGAGVVETLRSAASAISRAASDSKVSRAVGAGPYLRFRTPRGIAVDAAGNIYVAETDARQIRTILQNGSVVPAVAPNAVQQPRGVTAAGDGRLVVADAAQPLREIRYGEPSITSIEPGRVSNRGGDRVTIRGKNFDPSSRVVMGGVRIQSFLAIDSETIAFQTPAFASGAITLTVESRGGIVQTSVSVQPVPLTALPPGQITTVAGGTTYRGDGSLATSAQLAFPFAVAFDGDYVFIADEGNNQVRRINSITGVINTVAGSGSRGYSGDNGPALLASFNELGGIAVDPAHNLVIADSGNRRIRRVNSETGIITTIAGNGLDEGNSEGDGGPAIAANLRRPRAIAFDSLGNLFIADSSACRVRRVAAATQIISTVAGDRTGNCGFQTRDNVLATSTSISNPFGIAIDASGNIFVSNFTIRRIDGATGIITTIAAEGRSPETFQRAIGLAADGAGNIYAADDLSSRIHRIDGATGLMTTFAGNGAFGFSGDQGAAAAAALNAPVGVGADAAGNVFIADRDNNRIRKVAAGGGSITTVAGSGDLRFSGDGGPAVDATLFFPAAIALDPFNVGVALDASSNLYISDKFNHRVRKVDSATGIIRTIAGNGERDFSGDSGPATAASLDFPGGIDVDGAGNVLIADSLNNRIRRVDAGTGFITTIAGDGDFDYGGDGGPAVRASLAYPMDVAVDVAGNIYIADTVNSRVRRVSTSGVITTIAGNGEYGFSGMGGPATQAELRDPTGLALDSFGNLYIADISNDVVWKVDSRGIISIAAGTGSPGFSGDGGVAVNAELMRPVSVAVDADGNLFIADYEFDRIRRVDRQTGIIETVAGNGEYGFSADNAPAVESRLAGPAGLVLDAAGNLYIADSYNNRVRAVRGAR